MGADEILWNVGADAFLVKRLEPQFSFKGGSSCNSCWKVGSHAILIERLELMQFLLESGELDTVDPGNCPNSFILTLLNKIDYKNSLMELFKNF